MRVFGVVWCSVALRVLALNLHGGLRFDACMEQRLCGCIEASEVVILLQVESTITLGHTRVRATVLSHSWSLMLTCYV